MAKQWTPPSEQVEEVHTTKVWTPPADQVEELKKKDLAKGGENTLKPLPTGLEPSQVSPTSTNQFLSPLQPQQQTDLIPVPNPQVKKEVRANQNEQVNNENKPLKEFYNQLTPEARYKLNSVTNAGLNKPQDTLREPTKEETVHYNFMQTPVGKTLGAVAYVGSKTTKGTLAVVKGAAHLANLGLNATNPVAKEAVEQGLDKGFDKVDKVADYGLTPTDKSNYDDSKAISALGMAAEFAPTVAMGEAVGAPKALMYLQGVGQGKDMADNLEKGGAKLNPIAKEALIQGSGAVNLLLTDIFKGNGVTHAMQDKVITGIAADAIKESAGKDITVDSFKKLLENKAQDFAQRFERAPIEALGHYNETAKTFIKLNAGNFALHKAVDKLNDTPVFNENLGDLAANTQKALTQDAPIFAAIPAVKELTKLLPNTGYRNDVVDAIIKNPSPENIDAIKNKLYEYGFDQNNPDKWTPEEMDATYKHIDKIAQATRSLPNTIKPDKHADAIGLVMGRNDLQEQLSSIQEGKKSLDPAIQDIPTGKEQYLTDKIEQANDKLRDIVSGTKTSYSKGIGDDEGKFFKKTGDKVEEITPQRYALETTERDAHTVQHGYADDFSGRTDKETITDEQKAKLPTSEEHATNNTETDKKIADFQAKFPDHKFDPLDDLPDHVVRTFDRIDNDVPTDPTAIKEASDWLYGKYKELTKMKESDTRRLTLEQIDSYQKQIGEDISSLEEHAKTYHPDYEKRTEEIKPTEPATIEPDSSTKEVTPINPIENESSSNESDTKSSAEEKGSSQKEKESSNQESDSKGTSEKSVADEKANVETVSGEAKAEPAIKVGDDYKLANETGKVIRVKELDNGDTELKVKKSDDTSETVILSKETVSKTESVEPVISKLEISPERQKAIDAVTYGIIYPETIKAGDTTARIDLDMTTTEKRKAFKDISKGDYETAPAKQLLDKLERFEKNDDYPVIEGTGGNSVRRQGLTAKDINDHLEVAKEYQLAKERDLQKDNERLQDLGITSEQIQAYHEYRAGQSGTSDNGRPAKVPTRDAQRTEDVKATSTPPRTSSEATQPKPKAGYKLREVADKIRDGKIKKLGSFKSHTPASLVWDGSLEAVAKAIDGGAKIADAIQKGVEHIKESDWYKGLSKERQDEVIGEYVPHMEEQLNEPKEPIGITKAETKKQREERGLEDLPEAEKTTLKNMFNEGQEAIKDGKIKPRELAAEVTEKARNLSSVEVNALLSDRRSLHDEAEQLRDELTKIPNDPFLHKQFSERLSYVEQQLESNEKALRAGARENALALVSMQNMINSDYSHSSQLARMTAKAGGALTEEMKAEVDRYSKELDAAKKELEKYKRSESEAKARKEVEKSRSEARKAKTQVAKDDLKAERKNIVDDFLKQLEKRRKSGTFNSAGKAVAEFIIDAAPFMKKMIVNLAKEGIVEFKDVVDKIHDEFKDHIENLSKDDVVDALAGQYDIKKQTISELTKEKNEIIRIAKLTKRLEDLQNGVKTEKREKQLVEKRKEIADLEAEIKALQKENRINTLEERTQESLQKRLDAINKRIADKDFEPTEKRPKIEVKSAKTIHLEANVRRAENNFDAMAERLEKHGKSKFEKALNTYRKINLAFILSGVKVLGKLYGFGAAKRVTNLMDEVANTVNSKTPFLNRIINRSPRYAGGLNVKAEIKALSARWNMATAKDVWETAKTGMGDLERLYGKSGIDKDFEHNYNFLDFFQHIHGALKTATKRAEFFRSFEHRLTFYAGKGEDINDPDVQFKAGAEAYVDAKRAILMNDNYLTDKFYKAGLRGLEQGGNTGKALGAFIRGVFPITKVPTNFALNAYDRITGAIPLFSRATPLLFKGIAKGAESLTDEQASSVARILAKGQVGLAMMTLAYLAPKGFIQMGGYYAGTRKKDDLKAGDVIVGGEHIPHNLAHNDVIEAMQFITTIKRAQESALEQGKDNGTAHGVAQSLKGLAETIPFVDSKYITDLSSDKAATNTVGTLIKNKVEPRLVQEVAETRDKNTDKKFLEHPYDYLMSDTKKRDPQSIKENLMTGIPGLREHVALKLGKEEKAMQTVKRGEDSKYILNDKQVKERKEIIDEFVKSYGDDLVEQANNAAEANTTLQNKIKERKKVWEQGKVMPSKQQSLIKELTDEFVKNFVTTKAKEFSNNEMLERHPDDLKEQ